MSVHKYGLGGRVPLFDPHEMTGARKKTCVLMNTSMVSWATQSGLAAQTADGRMIEPFNGFLLTPEITSEFLALQGAEEKYTKLHAFKKRTRGKDYVSQQSAAGASHDYRVFSQEILS